jgi:methionyl-tRNA formyltransferase
MADALRIVFMGSPEFAVPSLAALSAAGHTPIAVVSGSDKRRGRGNILTPTPVKAKAIELGIPVLEADSLKDAAIQASLAALKPDLFVVVAFKILPTSLLAVPRIGSINAHASLLPKYRGAAPIHWAIANGETETGVTIFFLNEGIDTGGIFTSARTPIGPDETTGDVYERLMRLSAETLVGAVDSIAKGDVSLQPQDDSLSTPAPKVWPDDAWLDLSMPAQAVKNHVRAFNPFPGAWLKLDGKKLRVHSVDVWNASQSSGNDPLVIRTGDGHIRMTEIQLEGKARMDADSFANGYSGKWIIEGKKEYI